MIIKPNDLNLGSVNQQQPPAMHQPLQHQQQQTITPQQQNISPQHQQGTMQQLPTPQPPQSRPEQQVQSQGKIYNEHE